jgi:hypothetical protein
MVPRETVEHQVVALDLLLGLRGSAERTDRDEILTGLAVSAVLPRVNRR